VSKSLLNIFTLEQGDTNKLCSKSPQELFNYVMEIKGNQIVLDQYNDAKINYRRALEELREQREILLSEQNKLAKLQRDKVDYEVYESFLNEKNQLENETLPLANYKEKRVELEKNDIEIKTQRGQVDTYRKNIEEIKMGRVSRSLNRNSEHQQFFQFPDMIR
jgi:chromosome segregation ATPase